MSVDVLILAAGAARRFGSNKLLALWRGRPLLEYVLEKAAALETASVNLVLGRYAAELDLYLQGLDGMTVTRFFNLGWQSGIGNSLAFGVAQLPPENAVLVLLADQPLIALEDLKKMLALWEENPARIACAEFAGTRGVPALFPAPYKNQLKSLSGDRGAKALLSAPDVVTLPMPKAATDIDLPSDLALLPSQ